MNRLAILSAALLFAGCAQDLDATDSTEQAATGENGQHGAPEHLQLGKDAKPSAGGGGGSPLMTNHGGDVIVQVKTMAIFWGAEWNTPSFPGDKITGLDAFFEGFSGSSFAGTSAEYDGTNNGFVSGQSTYLGHTIDDSAAPKHAINTATAVAEACKVTNNAPDPDGVYFLFTSTGAGHVSYCAWHSWGNCPNGAPIQVAYMPNLDGIGGCDPGDTWTKHSQGLAALANVTSHELQEAITDPRGRTWYDAGGQENGDKCAWSFDHAVTFKNGSQWKLQMEWSNEAYLNGKGLPNRSGQNGCLQD
jgi:hypothetical protein